MSEPVALINLLKVEPGNHEVLIALLTENIKTVVSTLRGWRSSRLIAADDGRTVAIYSEWNTAEDAESMRNNPRMQGFFPQIRALASFESVTGKMVLGKYSSGSPRSTM